MEPITKTPAEPGDDINAKMYRISALAGKLGELKSELETIFPEREHLIAQIINALLTREHVLVHGNYGTAKSDLVKAIFESFETPTVFSIALNKFMSESHVIGVPDPKLMREEGVLFYRREGGILDAELVELDEIFDANAPLLRVLLGILHERTFKRGRQVETALLHTAIASTNGDPNTIVKTAPELGAVIDRFLLISKVNYLQTSESRRQMYAKFAKDVRPTTRIAMSNLVEAANLICGTEIELSDEFIAVYDQVIQAYREAFTKPDQVTVSDRRACKLIKLIRSSAVLNGRIELAYEDIYNVRWGLCLGNDNKQHETFLTVAKPIIDKAIESQQQSFDQVCLELLKRYETDIPAIPDQGGLSSDELVNLIRAASALDKKIKEVTPQLPSNADFQRKLRERLSSVSAKLNQLLIPGT